MFAISVNKCGGSRNTIDYLYAWVCIPKKSKKYKHKSNHLVSEVYETKVSAQH